LIRKPIGSFETRSSGVVVVCGVKLTMAETCTKDSLEDLLEQQSQGDLEKEATCSFSHTPETFNKFQVRLDDILDFIFPATLQHPLAAGRLFAYGLYGPLDEDKMLRTGFKGRHQLSVWELDEMCVQIEREDICSIYLHKKSDLGLLSSHEQESLISQADAHLKKAKGRAMLPQISREDIVQLFAGVAKDPRGLLSFHELQKIIFQFRESRIANYKLVYPNLVSKQSSSSTKTLTLPQSRARAGKVSSSVAPPTMFQRMKGNTNPDIIKQVWDISLSSLTLLSSQSSAFLNKHSFKICNLNPQSVTEEYSISSNVRLLREVEPRCLDPYRTLDGQPTRAPWSDTCNVKGSQIGSLVKATPSSSTWKRTATLG
jgi:hypothetical protein